MRVESQEMASAARSLLGESKRGARPIEPRNTLRATPTPKKDLAAQAAADSLENGNWSAPRCITELASPDRRIHLQTWNVRDDRRFCRRRWTAPFPRFCKPRGELAVEPRDLKNGRGPVICHAAVSRPRRLPDRFACHATEVHRTTNAPGLDFEPPRPHNISTAWLYSKKARAIAPASHAGRLPKNGRNMGCLVGRCPTKQPITLLSVGANRQDAMALPKSSRALRSIAFDRDRNSSYNLSRPCGSAAAGSTIKYTISRRSRRPDQRQRREGRWLKAPAAIPAERRLE